MLARIISLAENMTSFWEENRPIRNMYKKLSYVIQGVFFFEVIVVK